MSKKRKVVLIARNNYRKTIKEILLGVEYDFLNVLYFNKDMPNNIELLTRLYNYFNTKEQDFYLKNVIIISKEEYLANDLRVKAVITPKDIENFKYDEFKESYENSDVSIGEFIQNCAEKFDYKYDIYKTDDTWLYTRKGTNILYISKDTKEKIINNYHKIKYTYPDVIISIYDKDNNDELIKILDFIGNDANLIITFINEIPREYGKKSDVFIHIDDQDFEKIGKIFTEEIFNYLEYPKVIKKLIEFFDLDEKKSQKHYLLKSEKGHSLKTDLKIVGDELHFNIGLNKLYILKKI